MRDRKIMNRMNFFVLSGLAIRPPKYLVVKFPLSLCNFPRCVTAVALSVRLRIDHPKIDSFLESWNTRVGLWSYRTQTQRDIWPRIYSMFYEEWGSDFACLCVE